MGRMFGSLVGSSEENVRKAIAHAVDKAAVVAALGQARTTRQGRGFAMILALAGVVAVVESARSALLWEVLHGAYTRLGLGGAVGGDRAFEQMVLARVIEPSSKAQVPRVLGDLGLESVSVRTLFRSLARAQERGYRESLSNALFEHVTASGGLALCLYDVTTLYFEAEREDDLRKVGYSKDRRVDPQIIVGLLVDRTGLPLRNRLPGGQQGRDHHDHPHRGGLPGRSRYRRARHRR